MSNKIGRFEILSELAKSNTGCVYKANDPESGQVLALKTINLEAFGEHADGVVERILQEAETTKDLNTSNIALVYGAGEIDGQFCAAMEYVQGNSIATMLSRKEGFSIWDLLDISRQVSQALDYAHEHNVFHYSLEPAKVMVTWDGTVKLLSFGISSTGYVNAQAKGEPPSVLYYMSPEQISGDALDARSNLFTWGAMLYEMVTDRRAFDGADADEVRRKIQEEMPVPPSQVNPKINAVASAVIMKAVAKDPGERYKTGKELAAELEKCRDAQAKSAKKPAAVNPAVAPNKAPNAAAAAKFAGPVAKAPAVPSVPAAPAFTPTASNSDLETDWTPPVAAKPVEPPKPAVADTPVRAKAAAAAASTTATGRASSSDSSAQFISATVRVSVDALTREEASMSVAGAAPAIEPPKIAVDPMMAESSGETGSSTSFSEMTELPPLKEVYIAPPPPKHDEPVDTTHPSIILRPSEPEKPKVDPREVAEKAIKEIKGVPPKLLAYSVGGALAIIVVIGAAMAWHNFSQSTDEEGRVPAAAKPAVQAEPAPAPAQPTAAPEAVQPAPVAAEQPAPEEPAPAPSPARSAAPAAKGRAAKSGKKQAPVPVISVVPGQLTIDSNPEGAQVQIDGRGDAAWVTPYNVTGLAPGAHTVLVSKSGFGQESRSIEIASGSKSTLAVQLAQLNSVMSVASDPPGASIILDGKDTQKVTPAQITIDKGVHTVLVRKTGYLDETTSATGQPGQSFRFSPTLRALGNVEDIKTVGKFKKIFGGNAAQAGMGKISIRSTPKGAQVSVNRRMLEKTTPVDFLLDPGNYIIEITATGYKPTQKVITVEKNGTVQMDETLQPD